jgi:hypothetical protein
MRIRIGKKSLIAVGIAGSVLLCGALFKMTTDNGVIKNHEVAHVGTEHSGLSDAVVDLLGGENTAGTAVQVDANADAAVLAGVTMSADETDANQAAPVATTETQVQDKVEDETPAQAPVIEAATQTDAPVQETVATPATTVVEEAAPVEEVVESVQTVTVSTPVTKEVVTTVQVPVEETVVEEVQTQSFKGALGGNTAAGADEARQSIVTPTFSDDGVDADNNTGGDEFIIFN